MRKGAAVCLFAAVLLSLIYPQVLLAGTFGVYSPHLYVRADGDPVTVSAAFRVPNPAATTYTLRIWNGGLVDDVYDKVSSTVIYVNGQPVIAPNDLNQNIPYLERTVILQQDNVIDVQVRGKPGGALSIDIVGVDDARPAITASLSPQPNGRGWNNSPVTVSFQCSDVISGIASCPAPVTISSEGASQVVSGEAVDRAGNTAEVNVTVNVDMTPPTVVGVASPSPNSSGWNNSDVTASFSCADDLSSVESCTGSETIATEGVTSVAGTGIDRAGNTTSSSVHLQVDKTPPDLVVLSPLSGAVADSPTQTFTGNVSDAFSGIATLTCSGVSATVSGSSFSCVVTLAEGTNDVVVSAVDWAGNSAQRNVTVTYASTLNPPPNYLVLTPARSAMLIDEVHRLALSDDLGRQIHGATLTVSSPGILEIVPGEPYQVHGVGAGEVTLTAVYGGLSAQATVRVFSDEIPDGTVRWSVSPLPLPGQYLRDYAIAQPSVGAPVVFTTENTYPGSVLRGYSNDGAQIWLKVLGSYSQRTMSAMTTTDQSSTDERQEELARSDLEEAAASAGKTRFADGSGPVPQKESFQTAIDALRDWMDKTGGDNRVVHRWLALMQTDSSAVTNSVSTTTLATMSVAQSSLPSGVREYTRSLVGTKDGGLLLYTLGYNDGWPTTYYRSLVELDASTGAETWRYISTGSLDAKWALHPNGTVYVVENNTTSSRILGFDIVTGEKKAEIPIPTSTVVHVTGYYCDQASQRSKLANNGPLMIAPDGSTYLEYQNESWTTRSCDGMLDFHASLNLLRIDPSGNVSSRVLQSKDYSGRGEESYYGIPYGVHPYEWNPATNGVEWFPRHFPGELVPDGQEGILAAWTYFPPTYWYDPIAINTLEETRISHITGNQQADYSLPLKNWQSTGALVVGENNTAFATDVINVVAFDLTTGAPKWQWKDSGGKNVEQMYAAADGHLVAALGNSVVRFDTTGTPTYDTWTGTTQAAVTATAGQQSTPLNLSTLRFNYADQWFAFNNDDGSLAAIDPPSILWATSMWAESTARGTRAAKRVLRIRAFKVIGSNVDDEPVRAAIHGAMSTWTKNAGMLFSWDDVVQPIPACPPNYTNCPVDSDYNILDITIPEAVTPMRVRVQDFIAGQGQQSDKGVNLLFTRSIYAGAAGATVLRTDPSGKFEGFLNIAFFPPDPGDIVVAHEMGHIFGLYHVGLTVNLMCGPSNTWDDRFLTCSSLWSRFLTQWQDHDALANSRALEEEIK